MAFGVTPNLPIYGIMNTMRRALEIRSEVTTTR